MYLAVEQFFRCLHGRIPCNFGVEFPIHGKRKLFATVLLSICTPNSTSHILKMTFVLLLRKKWQTRDCYEIFFAHETLVCMGTRLTTAGISIYRNQITTGFEDLHLNDVYEMYYSYQEFLHYQVTVLCSLSLLS